MTTTYIYALKDPRDGRARYVGKSDNPRGRYSAHLKCHTQMTSKKDKWVAELRAVRLKPVLERLEEVPRAAWEDREQWWIKHYADSLLNGTRGGRTMFVRTK
jgi:hypothetical protein